MGHFGRLERVSAVTALGIWADGVVLALDRATRLSALNDADRKTFDDAIAVLVAARDLSEHPGRVTSKALAATGTALNVAEDMVEESSPARTRQLLEGVEDTLRNARQGALAQGGVTTSVTEAIEYFAAIGRRQLAEGNRISGYSGGPERWKAKRTMSSFS